MNKQDLLSLIPSVDEILKSEKGLKWQENYPRRYVLRAIREILDEIRRSILKNEVKEVSLELLFKDIELRLERLIQFSLRPVLNATGIVIHTNLGRSVLSEDVIENVKRIACGYSNLEYDLEKGQRGKRYSHVQELLKEITGAESSLVVNNNAAAVFVCLSTLAKGREVIVSRGELVEIGGSFRVPDVMSSSGAILKEIGTTNKTHLYDYERVINENTALLLKVHQSNFRTIGFTKLIEVDELVSLGKKYKIPVMFDLGSGCLIDLKPYGIYIEPTVQEVVKSGCDIVTFSGDKLLGGPQCGVIVGRSELIERISKNPLMRAIRIDKLTLSAFEAVIRHYLDEEKAKKKIPTLRMLLQDVSEIKVRAKKIAIRLKRLIPEDIAEINVFEDSSQSGGGALPEIEFKTYIVSIKPARISVNKLEERLRYRTIPIIARIKENSLIIDARTISDKEIAPLVKGISDAIL